MHDAWAHHNAPARRTTESRHYFLLRRAVGAWVYLHERRGNPTGDGHISMAGNRRGTAREIPGFRPALSLDQLNAVVGNVFRVAKPREVEIFVITDQTLPDHRLLASHEIFKLSAAVEDLGRFLTIVLAAHGKRIPRNNVAFSDPNLRPAWRSKQQSIGGLM